MARSVHAVGVVLVAMLCVVVCTMQQATAELLRSPRHAHRYLRRAAIAEQNTLPSQDCPDDSRSLAAYVQNKLKSLSPASALQGGKEQVFDTDLPGKTGRQHVQIKAQSSGDSNPASRSWSWSWWSHTSSEKPSSDVSSPSSDSSHGPGTEVGVSTLERGDHAKMQKDSPQEQVKRDQKPLNSPHSIESPTEIEPSLAGHTDETSHQAATTSNTEGSRDTKSSNSLVHASHRHSSNVFQYVISGNAAQSINIAPFTNAEVQWTRSPGDVSDNTAGMAIGQPISRPAKPETCNRLFPFTGHQYTANDKDHRFDQPYPQEALDAVSKLALDLHNRERARYGLIPLQWNINLANMAACWADLKGYGHSEDHFCASGENIAVGLGDPCYSDPMEGMQNAIMSFLDEDRNWAENPHESESTGHWTQVVWKDTRAVGCAVAQRKGFMEGYSADDKASMYVVCEYYPPGNVVGQFDKQVPAVRPMPQLRSSCSANEKHGS